MSHSVALLRGINVGGHRVKMDRLRELFEQLGLAGVETHIASGNVLFGGVDASSETAAMALERRIEEHLERALGYAVATYLRTPSELAKIAAADPFSPAELAAADRTLYLVFLHRAPDAAACERIEALGDEEDQLRVARREVYWLRRGKISDSPLTVPRVEKAAGGVPGTRRKVTTVVQLAAKLAAKRG